MKALSLWQPWASLMTHGKKRLETRSAFFAKRLEKLIGQTLLIHAAKRWTKEEADLCTSGDFDRALKECGFKPITYPNGPVRLHWSEMPFGAIIGAVTIRGIISTERVKWHPSANYFAYDFGGNQLVITAAEKAFGNYDAGRIAVITSDPVTFATPLPHPGRQSLFDVPDVLLPAGIREQLAGRSP
jgi:hypothetical protein